MDTLSSHYSGAMNPGAMIEWAYKEAVRLKELFETNKNRGFPVLVYSGMSGINHAAYLSRSLFELGIEFGQICVRKENEETHGRDVEHSSNIEQHKHLLFIFVDDFIGRGVTLKRTIRKAITSYNNFHTQRWAILSLEHYCSYYNEKLMKQNKTSFISLLRIQKTLIHEPVNTDSCPCDGCKEDAKFKKLILRKMPKM